LTPRLAATVRSCRPMPCSSRRPGAPQRAADPRLRRARNLTFNLTVYGPKSRFTAHYGNWVTNPPCAAQLLPLQGRQRPRAGGGFYDGLEPLRARSRPCSTRCGRSRSAEAALRVSAAESPDRSLQEGLQMPSFNVRGLASAFVGANARTISRSRRGGHRRAAGEETPPRDPGQGAGPHPQAGLPDRLGGSDDTTPRRYSKIVKLTVRGDGTNAYRTSPLLPVSRQLAEAMTRVFGDRRPDPHSAARCHRAVHRALGFRPSRCDGQLRQQPARREREPPLGHFFRGIVTIRRPSACDEVSRCSCSP